MVERNIDKNDLNDNKWILRAIVLCLVNLFSSGNFLFAVMVVSVEIIILIKCLARGQLVKYFCYWLIFLCSSFEFEETVGATSIYGFKGFELAGISLSTWMLLPLIFWGVISNWSLVFTRKKNVYNYTMYTILLGLLGVGNGLISIIINDNGINSFSNVEELFFAQFYVLFIMEFLIMLAYIITKNSAIGREQYFISEITNTLIAILFGCVISMLFSKITNIVGIYGGVETLMAQNVIRYVPFLYIYSVNEKNPKKKMFGFLVSTLGVYLSLTYNATGKMLLLYAVVAVIVLIHELKYNKVIGLLEIGILVVGASFLWLSIKDNGGEMLSIKMHEVTSLFSFNENWLKNMSASPRVRVGELIDIFFEYLNKPLRILFGKGYLGTIIDHSNLLYNLGSGSYTSQEIVKGVFYGVHESTAVLLLNNGLFGLYFLVKYVIKLTSGVTKSINNMSGIFWISMSYGFSFTLTGFGLVALLICLSEKDIEVKEMG